MKFGKRTSNCHQYSTVDRERHESEIKDMSGWLYDECFVLWPLPNVFFVPMVWRCLETDLSMTQSPFLQVHPLAISSNKNNTNKKAKKSGRSIWLYAIQHISTEFNPIVADFIPAITLFSPPKVEAGPCRWQNRSAKCDFALGFPGFSFGSLVETSCSSEFYCISLQEGMCVCVWVCDGLRVQIFSATSVVDGAVNSQTSFLLWWIWRCDKMKLINVFRSKKWIHHFPSALSQRLSANSKDFCHEIDKGRKVNEERKHRIVSVVLPLDRNHNIHLPIIPWM